MTSFTVYLARPAPCGLPYLTLAVQAACATDARRVALLQARALRVPVAGVVRVEGAPLAAHGDAERPSAKIFRLAA